MKIIKHNFEIISQQNGLEGIYKQIEIAGRVCYKSENNITENSAEEFVNRMINSGHWAMLEHGTVYLYLPPYSPLTFYKYRDNKYSKFIQIRDGESPKPSVHTFVTTNYRVLVENNWLDDLKYLCEPTKYHEKRITVKFTMDRIGSQSFCRHRTMSFAQESTRYCNYSKEKFGNEITINLPEFINYDENSLVNKDLYTYCDIIANKENEAPYTNMSIVDYWLFANLACEFSYLNMIKLGAKPQEARSILPSDLNTEIIQTALVSDWKHFFDLRTSKAAHPDARALALSLQEKFLEFKFI